MTASPRGHDVRRRRIVAFLTGLLMLHLGIVGTDLACARHAGGPAAGMGHSGAGGAHAPGGAMAGAAATHAASGAADASSLPCQTPVASNCCGAMTSCAVAFVVARASHPSLPEAGDVLMPAAERKPARSLGAPEPPPPKA